MFGNIKVFKWPLFLVYDPTVFSMDGAHVRKVLGMVQPGDIVLRGYDMYLDGFFIPDPLKYSHAGIYIGDGIIVHAVAKGASAIDIVDFMQCDRICIIRPAKGQKQAIRQAKKFLKDNVPYDYGFQNGVSSLYCFELCASCYPKLEIKKFPVTKFFGLVKRNVYLANSFRQSFDMKVVLEYNKKFSIDIP